MATVQERGGSFRILFLYRGKRQTFTLGAVPRRLAEAKAAKVEELLALFKGGYLIIPDGIPVVEFMRAEGKAVVPPPSTLPCAHLSRLRDDYLAAHAGSLESNSLACAAIHFRHLVRTLGEGFDLASLTLADLQRHADRRAKNRTNRGTPVSPVTIKKDFTTFRAAWGWGLHAGIVSAPFPPLKRVRLAKSEEKPPFQTMEEIERRVAASGLAGADADALWECLYLTPPEVSGLLRHL